MKYRLLIDVGSLKKGTIYEAVGKDEMLHYQPECRPVKTHFSFYPDEIHLLVDQGIIKGIPEPRWNDEEVVELIHFARSVVDLNTIDPVSVLQMFEDKRRRVK